MNEIVREFLLETHENLAQLDLDLVTLEKEPTERETLARVFRTLHTVKGTAGFLGLMKLQRVAHAAESLLSKLRAGELLFHSPIATTLLATVDAIKRMLDSVEKTEQDGNVDYPELIGTLDRLRTGGENTPAPTMAFAPHAPITDASVTPTPLLAPTEAPRAPITDVPGAPKTAVGVPEATKTPDPMHTIAPAVSRGVKPLGSPVASAVSDSSIRVDVGLLDSLMTLVGELVLARNQIVQFSNSQENAAFLGTVQKLNLLTTELQTGVMKTRMQPIGNLWSKLPRLVRDISVACGKQVRLEMEGRDTELDKTIIEAIRDPLTHLVRNSIDHGIEVPAERQARGKPTEGIIKLHAFHQGGKVILSLSDDGAGIDPERVRRKALAVNLVTPEQAARMNERELLNLIFQPGFSTAEKVTNFSGRGVGMDVVRTNIEKIGGSVDLESRLGKGTTVEMKIPLTLAIIPALTATCGGERYAIPQVSLLEMVRLEAEHVQLGIELLHGVPVYRLRGKLLPIVYLKSQLEIPPVPKNEVSEINIVVLQADDRPFGLVVDAIHDTEEIVVKPLQKVLKGIGTYAGATIMGDGKVALILDVLGLAQRAHVVSGVRERSLEETFAETDEDDVERQSVLLFSADDGGRMALPLSQVARLEEFPRSAVERVGPQEVIQYRQEILPLLNISRMLKRRRGSKFALPPTGAETIQVVVYRGEKQQVGLVVGSILDIVEEAIVVRSGANQPGVLFTAVIQGRVTEVLDVEALLRAADPDFFEQPGIHERAVEAAT